VTPPKKNLLGLLIFIHGLIKTAAFGGLMSVKIMAMVFSSEIPETRYMNKNGVKYSSSPPAQKLVLLALADHASDTGESIYPSIEYLCRKTSMSNRTCITALQSLEIRKIIAFVRNHPRGNKEYRIDVKTLSGYVSRNEATSLLAQVSYEATSPPVMKPLHSSNEATSQEPSLTINKPIENKKTTYSQPRKVRPPISQNPQFKSDSLYPTTKIQLAFFAKIGNEFHAKGRRRPQHFPSLECRDRFREIEKRLGENVSIATADALAAGITAIPGIVAYLAKWGGSPKRPVRAGKSDAEIIQEVAAKAAREKFNG
jgi:hypothetical protein